MNLTHDVEPCNNCESCKSFNSNRSFNIHELDAASNNSVEDIRSLIDQVRILPQIGKYSIYIIDEVHMLSSQAFNAFLKTLEEPPAHAIFILATTEKHKIIPTILSRCQIFDFNRINVDDITHHLEYVAQQEKVEVSLDGLNIIAQKADGAMRDALSYFDQIVSFSGGKVTYENVIENLNVLDYEYYFKLTDYFVENNFAACLTVFNEILNKGFDGHHFISGLARHFRDLLVSKDPVTIQLLEVGDTIRDKYLQQAKNIPLSFVLQALNFANACDLAYKSSQDKRLQVELSLINISMITKKKQEPEITSNKTLEPVIASSEKPANETENPENINKMTSISIKDALKSNGSATKATPGIEEKESEDDVKIEKNKAEFTIDQLTGIWEQFAELIKQEKPRLHHILKSTKPGLKDKFTITVVLGNTLQKETFDKAQAEIMKFLSSKLRNDHLLFELEIDEQTGQKQLFTDNDKLKYLTEKNPNLAAFKQKLDLDF